MANPLGKPPVNTPAESCDPSEVTLTGDVTISTEQLETLLEALCEKLEDQTVVIEGLCDKIENQTATLCEKLENIIGPCDDDDDDDDDCECDPAAIIPLLPILTGNGKTKRG